MLCSVNSIGDFFKSCFDKGGTVINRSLRLGIVEKNCRMGKRWVLDDCSYLCKGLYNIFMNNQTIKTPCVDICKYNKQNFCVGCKRSSDEISGWIHYSDEMRQAIMQDLKNRKID